MKCNNMPHVLLIGMVKQMKVIVRIRLFGVNQTSSTGNNIALPDLHPYH